VKDMKIPVYVSNRERTKFKYRPLQQFIKINGQSLTMLGKAVTTYSENRKN